MKQSIFKAEIGKTEQLRFEPRAKASERRQKYLRKSGIIRAFGGEFMFDSVLHFYRNERAIRRTNCGWFLSPIQNNPWTISN